MMLKTFALAAALMLASAVPAAAESLCSEPIAPAPVNGAVITHEQLLAALADATTFIKQSDGYQDCLNKEFDAAALTAKKDKKDLDPALLPAKAAKIQANQALKEKVGAEFNAASHAWHAAHPG